MKLILFLTQKTIVTPCIYGLRYFIESAIRHRFSFPTKLGIDLSYIAMIFLGFNIIQTNPASRLYKYSDAITKKYPEVGPHTPIFILGAVALAIWIYALLLYHRYERLGDLPGSITNRVFWKKAFILGRCCAIGALLFLVAVQTQ